MSRDGSSGLRTVRILGTRGIPAAHGGFETFAERLAEYLRQRGWRVVVYCQQDGDGPITEDLWNGIERVHVPVPVAGAPGTMLFDWRAIRHASRSRDLCLTLGYNTAVFCLALRLRGIPNVINMDGIEWKRSKWSRPARLWFWANDWIGCKVADHLIADNPQIRRHLMTRVVEAKIATIPYGADRLQKVGDEALAALGIEAGRYLTLIARPEPENSVLELVRAFSSRRRGVKLLVLGHYERSNPYHARVLDAASIEVLFPGAIYDRPTLRAIRFHCLAYLHGHQVGGTNPSLVEAIGASNPVIANDNPFNRSVMGDAAIYFRDYATAEAAIDRVLDDHALREHMRAASEACFDRAYSWHGVLTQYEQLLERQIGRHRARRRQPVIAAEAPDAVVKR
ncbi:MAG: DUF1972 domain-containing protein [Burkholderiaceae bacterium]